MTPAQADVELLIGGMTCASCAARIEKKLNRLDGVTATVNYATEKAKVSYGPGVTPDDLVATVEKTGYSARLPEPLRLVEVDTAGQDADGEAEALPEFLATAEDEAAADAEEEQPHTIAAE